MQLNKPASLAGACALALCATVTVMPWPGGTAHAEEPAGAVSDIRFGRDIRPILSDRCFKCHGPDIGTRAANLRLDLREAATELRKGGAAVVPGSPESSRLWQRVTSDDPHFRMPPPDSNKRPLTADEQNLVRRWIEAGAPYEPHWAFQPPRRPPVPQVRDAAWVRGPVDRFVLASLERQGIRPSAEADRTTLIRRAFLDLTGLPPTPDETNAFLADTRPDAWERWLEKLLTEEPYRTRYAERMTVPWLDAARYADTSGIHTDAGRQMWLWRDWVLHAYRDNMRFDRFVTEQLAGDLLPEATEQQKIASGFNRNHVTTDEGGAISEEYLVEYAADRTSTTGSVFLGLTLGCARCHDHKFDPVTQEDYYRVYAFFNSNEEPGLYSQEKDPNRAFEPFMVVPTPEQRVQLASFREKLSEVQAELARPRFQEDIQRQTFILDAQKQTGLLWESARVTGASSVYGATLMPQADGSVLAGGQNPAKDEHHITLRTDARDLRLMMLEALPDPSLPKGRIGRADNGNAVLAGIDAEARSIADPARRSHVRFVWAWADVEQSNGDHRIVNALDAWDDLTWAVDGHNREGRRVALLLADKPFGFEGGTELRVRLRYDSQYAQHVLGRVRLSLARLGDAGLNLLPAASSSWYMAGPFNAASKEAAYDKAFGPERDATIDTAKKYGKQSWTFAEKLAEGQINPVGKDGVNVTYIGRRVLSPTARTQEISLGSDDGFALFVNGRQVAFRQVDRGAAPDQEKIAIDLRAGENTVVLKIVNTGGPAAFYYRTIARANELFDDLVASLIPESARGDALEARLVQAWREAYSPGYREQQQLLATTQKGLADLDAKTPRTMVMKELPKPRETFLLLRGQYDKPDKKRPIARAIPAALGTLPSGAPANRLGLAQWLTSPDNPLVARVAVNRMWEMLFGSGLVRTSEDFGLQGEWPSHPELLDWLAVEFRESGWDIQHMLRLMMASNTYRQSSRVRPELRERDPDNRLLAYFPRRRLGAEFIRDQALYVSGLLVEKLGGASVKPYQPDGLWQEVAMLQSNTRIYQRGEGPDLWRRSLYTYWKRACPPPSLMTFDAPTRESCTIRRASTNTPLQALVLWNDEQFVEAARVLAARTIRDTTEDRQRVAQLFRRCTGRAPEDAELQRIVDALGRFRDRYREKPDDAAALLKIGVSPAPNDLQPPELAAWTMVASALMNLSETVTQK